MRQLRAPIWAPLTAFLLLLFQPAFAQQGELQGEPLPVTRMLLYSNGVAYFEHEGIVEGSRTFELSVPREDMDDMLQSLVLQDFGGGSIDAVSYPSRDPLSRLLASYSLDLSGDPTFAQLLTQARGEPVTVRAGESISGVVVNVERLQHPEEGLQAFLTLSTGSGLRRIMLDEIRELTFERAELQRELEAALAAIASHRDAEEATLRVVFDGAAERRVSVGYVRAMPVWKSSYRLVVDGEGESRLQGWAIVDNPTDIDLEEIELTFVAGTPLSFVTELYAPLYVDRPRVELDTGPAIAAPEYEQAEAAPLGRMLDGTAEADFAPQPAPQPAAPSLEGAGVAEQAQGTRTGSTFSYRVGEPVTIPRHQSAMVPIIARTVNTEPVSVFNRSVLQPNPLRGVMLTNDSGLHLAGGPVSIFDEGGFAGNSRFAEITPDESRLLTYAIDDSVEVWPTSASEPEQVVAVALRNGVLEAESRERATTTYRIARRGQEEGFLIIEHPKRSGFELVAPADGTETAQHYRFGIELSAVQGEGASAGEGDEAQEAGEDVAPVQAHCNGEEECRLEVVLERVVTRATALSNLSVDQIAFYLENVELSADDRAALQRIREVRSRLGEHERAIAQRQSRVEELHRDQSRIRQNMSALDRNSSLYRRYVADLEEQEAVLDRLATEIEDERRQLEATRSELDALLRSFGED